MRIHVFILTLVTIMFFSCTLKRQYKREVKASIKSTVYSDSLVTETDIQHLPAPVQKYLRYAGVLNKKRVENFKVSFKGQIRDSAKGWMNFTSTQYNFLDTPTRLFYMKAVMKGLPVKGFHCYKDGIAFMDIRLLSLFRVQYQKGEQMNTAETVTFFNDMCCMAPATLIDKRIKWQETDNHSVKAWFTHKNITISAILYFNEEGQLVNFISNDRYAVTKDNTLKQLPWATPLKNYKEINGYRLATYAETIYTYPGGDFCYGRFTLMGLEYNSK